MSFDLEYKIGPCGMRCCKTRISIRKANGDRVPFEEAFPGLKWREREARLALLKAFFNKKNAGKLHAQQNAERRAGADVLKHIMDSEVTALFADQIEREHVRETVHMTHAW